MKAAEKKGIKILIHNHPLDSALSSSDDFFAFADYKVKYGCSTNKLGTFIVTNNDLEGNKNNAEQIKEFIESIEDKMEEDFKRFDKNFSTYTEEKYNQKLNTYIHNNKEKYIEMYENTFNEDETFVVKFIDSKGE